MNADALLTPAVRAALGLASPGGRRARLSTLIFHRVLPAPDPLLPGDPDAATFRWQMRTLARHFNVLPLGEAVQRLREGSLPPRAACVTFDDGYADNLTIAAPILRELGLPATFFIATGYLDGGRMFNDTLIELARRLPGERCDLSALGLGSHPLASAADRHKLVGVLVSHFKYLPPETRLQAAEALAASFGVTLPDDLMMSSAQLRELRALGMEIGGHTDSHPILARQDLAAAEQEIRLGKARLEEILGESPRLFAYPNGRKGKDYTEEHVALARSCGFDAAVSTNYGAASADSDPYQLPRFTPWDKTPGRFALRLLRNLYH
ncbi:polysaccharide deacetylase family protein [Azoarcus indigens]|uniref:Polysaccharide deacetylase n=1 Tax=Azoarcus indigens TaxID=29545 RepID=A0A4R6E7D1_9RHOO|nr:polysaccharide deacetylase family protein [Azoarcus indigens]NMG63882.1 polysaccharide deacetylase family protein [Azoarcus indigens]TDN53843.1 polysaccharide deacetylase [Azoarcus indigens]